MGLVTRIGAWAMRSAVLSPADDLKLAVAIGLTDISLCVHGADPGKPFKPFVSPAQFARIAQMCLAVGITPHAMFWPQPRAAHAANVLAYLHDTLRAGAPLGSADLDAEGPWCKSPHLAKHGKAIAAQYRAGWPVGLPLVVNAITRELDDPKTAAPWDGPLKELVAVADVVIPQAYTSTVPGQTSTPGQRQTQVIVAWREAAPHARMILGIAAYGQEGAGGLTAKEALTRAWDAGEAGGVTEVRCWDLSALRNGPARKFVEAKCRAIRGGFGR